MKHQTHSGSSWLHNVIYNLAWPTFICEACVGQSSWYEPCYCFYNDAVAPGKGPTKWHLMWRWIWDKRA